MRRELDFSAIAICALTRATGLRGQTVSGCERLRVFLIPGMEAKGGDQNR